MRGLFRIFIAILVVVLASPANTGTPAAYAHPEGNCANSFNDVGAHSWYCYPVRRLLEMGAAGGYPDGSWRPHSVVTRGQFSKMIVLAFNYTLEPANAPQIFDDVPQGSTFFQYVHTAVREGLMSGTSGAYGFYNVCLGGQEYPWRNYFRPCLNITRAQMSKPLAQAARFDDPVAGRSTFSDISSNDTFYPYIERLAMHNALEEIPFDTPQRPGCATSGSKACYQPIWEVRRSDAAQLIIQAKAQRVYGQAFPRRLREVAGRGGYNGVQAFVTTPIQAPPTDNNFIAGPLGVADAVNAHFIETGPYTNCYGFCSDVPYMTSDASINGSSRFNFDSNFRLVPGSSYEYRVFYEGVVANNHRWKAQYFNTNIQNWVTLMDVDNLGVDRMREVFGAAETSSTSFISGPMRVTNARARIPGSSSYNGWCYDPGIYPVKMFGSTFSATCPPPGVEPYSWDVFYSP